MNENQKTLINRILYREKSFVKHNLKIYHNEKDPTTLRLYQLAAASQGYLAVIHPFLFTNKAHLNSEILAVALYNQQLNVVSAILRTLNKPPVGLQFTSLFSIDHIPFQIKQQSEVSSVVDGAIYNDSSHYSSEESSHNQDKSLNSEQLNTSIYQQEDEQIYSLIIVLFVHIIFFNHYQIIHFFVDITSPRISHHIITLRCGSNKITHINDTLQTPYNSYNVPLHPIIPLRLIITPTETIINDIHIEHPNDATDFDFIITLHPYGVLSLSTESTPPSKPADAEPLISFHYPKQLIPFLPPPFPSHLSVLVYSLSKHFNNDLLNLYFKYTTSDSLQQQTTIMNSYALRLTAHLGESNIFHYLIQNTIITEPSVLRALVSSSFYTISSEIIGAINDVMGFNTALSYFPSASHIIDYRLLLKTALTTSSHASLQIITAKRIVGITNEFSSELLTHLLSSTPPSHLMILPLLPTPLNYYTANVDCFTNPIILDELLNNGALPGKLSPDNLLANQIIIKHSPSSVDMFQGEFRPLHTAVIEKNLSYTSWLLENNANPMLADTNGLLPISYTTENDQLYNVLIEKSRQISLSEPSKIFIEGFNPCILPNNIPIVVSNVADGLNVNVVNVQQFVVNTKAKAKDCKIITGTTRIVCLRNEIAQDVDVLTKELNEFKMKNSLLWNAPLCFVENDVYCSLHSLFEPNHHGIWKSNQQTISRLQKITDDLCKIDYLLPIANGCIGIDILSIGVLTQPTWVIKPLQNVRCVIGWDNVFKLIDIQSCEESKHWELSEIRNVSVDGCCIYFFIANPSPKKPHFMINLLSKTLVSMPITLQTFDSEQTCICNGEILTIQHPYLYIYNGQHLLFQSIQHLMYLFFRHENTDFSFIIKNNKVLKCHKFLLVTRCPFLNDFLLNSNELNISVSEDETLAFLMYLYTGDPTYPTTQMVLSDKTKLFCSFIKQLNQKTHQTFEPNVSFESLVNDFANINQNNLTLHYKGNDIPINKQWFEFLFPNEHIEGHDVIIQESQSTGLFGQHYNLQNETIWNDYIWKRILND
ncbi:Uncharacterized protein QTN25_005451 [Entamoeba marina]